MGAAGEDLLPLFHVMPRSSRASKASAIGAYLRHRLQPQADDANAVRREFGGEIAGERLLGRHRRTVTSDERDAGARVERGDRRDHAGFVRDHAARGQACGQE